MNKIQADKPEAQRWQKYTLAQYVALRNGVPLGDGRFAYPYTHLDSGVSVSTSRKDP